MKAPSKKHPSVNVTRIRHDHAIRRYASVLSSAILKE